MYDEDDPGEYAPARLVRDLRALHPPGEVPGAVDRRILRESRQALGVPRRRRFMLLRALPAAAAAGLLLWLVLELSPKHETGGAVALEDVDGSGRVDIIDAYALALRIEEQDLSPSERRRFDLDGDGMIGRGDVDRVASAAVRLGS